MTPKFVYMFRVHVSTHIHLLVVVFPCSLWYIQQARHHTSIRNNQSNMSNKHPYSELLELTAVKLIEEPCFIQLPDLMWECDVAFQFGQLQLLATGAAASKKAAKREASQRILDNIRQREAYRVPDYGQMLTDVTIVQTRRLQLPMLTRTALVITYRSATTMQQIPHTSTIRLSMRFRRIMIPCVAYQAAPTPPKAQLIAGMNHPAMPRSLGLIILHPLIQPRTNTSSPGTCQPPPYALWDRQTARAASLPPREIRCESWVAPLYISTR